MTDLPPIRDFLCRESSEGFLYAREIPSGSQIQIRAKSGTEILPRHLGKKMNHQHVAPAIVPIEINETEKHRSFVQFDQATLFDLLLKLEATEFKVFMFLSLRAYGWDNTTQRPGDGVERAAAIFIANGTELSEATAERCIKKLTKKGLISKSHHSCKLGNTYFVQPTLMRRSSSDGKSPPAEKPKPIDKPRNKSVQLPQIEGTKIEVLQKAAPSTLKKTVLGPSKRGTNIDSRSVDLSLSTNAKETFENYFSKIRAPITEKKERDCFAQIQKRNPDVTEQEFLECFKLVSQTKDSKGNPIAMKFLWMANGFDAILDSAKQRLESRRRQEAARVSSAQTAQQEAQLEQEATPEAVEQAKEQIRKFIGVSLFRPVASSQPQPSVLQDRRSFLLAQARQMEQMSTFGN